MPRPRWIKVDATIIECFRAWDEPLRAAHPRYEIVVDITTLAGTVERVTAEQKLNTATRHWRPPDPGDVVPARWDPARHKLRLALRGDPRYDERLIKAIGRTRHATTWPSTRV
jgi:hypothetical protein